MSDDDALGYDDVKDVMRLNTGMAVLLGDAVVALRGATTKMRSQGCATGGDRWCRSTCAEMQKGRLKTQRGAGRLPYCATLFLCRHR